MVIPRPRQRELRQLISSATFVYGKLLLIERLRYMLIYGIDVVVDDLIV